MATLSRLLAIDASEVGLDEDDTDVQYFPELPLVEDKGHGAEDNERYRSADYRRGGPMPVHSM
jgi:hypothetical protein